MLIPKGQIEAAASKDKSRPVITEINLKHDGDGKAWLEATDSYVLVRVPVIDAEEDVDGLIPVEALKAARKGVLGRIDAGEDSVSVPGSNSASFSRTQNGIYPNARSLFPERTTEFAFGVNAKSLYALAKALGSDEIQVSFTPDAEGQPNVKRPLFVKPIKAEDERQGLCMPIRLGGF